MDGAHRAADTAARDLAPFEALEQSRPDRNNHWTIHVSPPSTFEHIVNRATNRFLPLTNTKRFKRKALYIPLTRDLNGQPPSFYNFHNRIPLSTQRVSRTVLLFQTLSQPPSTHLLCVIFLLSCFHLRVGDKSMSPCHFLLFLWDWLPLPLTHRCVRLSIYTTREPKSDFRILFFQVVFCSREVSASWD